MLVRPRDVEGFATAVRELLDDPALRARIGRRARARVLEEFRLDGSIAAYLDLYRLHNAKPPIALEASA
jgi:glycosyltransferase involved in cell wall biosynthesis